MVDLILAATFDRQDKDDSDRTVPRRQSKVPSTKVPVDFDDRFNLLAEYLFERGLSASFTTSALLCDIVEQLLTEYRDGLAAYEMHSY